MRHLPPNQSAAAKRRPAGQSGGSDNVSATVAADRAFPAAVAELKSLGDSMKFADGTDIRPGDLIQIDTVYRGRVVASIDTNEDLPGEDSWAYLGKGIMVDTDFGGLVHYT